MELSRLKWSDDSDSVSPLGEFILVGCQLIQQFPVSFSRKPLSNMIYVALEERRERDMEKQKSTWTVVAVAVGLREDIHGA